MRARADEFDVLDARSDADGAGEARGELIDAVRADGITVRAAHRDWIRITFGRLGLRNVGRHCQSISFAGKRNARRSRRIGREVGGVDRYDAILDGDPRSRPDARQSEQAAQIELVSNPERLPRAFGIGEPRKR